MRQRSWSTSPAKRSVTCHRDLFGYPQGRSLSVPLIPLPQQAELKMNHNATIHLPATSKRSHQGKGALWLFGAPLPRTRDCGKVVSSPGLVPGSTSWTGSSLGDRRWLGADSFRLQMKSFSWFYGRALGPFSAGHPARQPLQRNIWPLLLLSV